LLPLIELESRPIPAELRGRVGWIRTRALERLTEVQGDWHGWTWRNDGRLAAAQALVARRHLPSYHGGARQCDGRPMPPPPPIPDRDAEPPVEDVQTVQTVNEAVPAENETPSKPLTEPSGR